MATTGSLRIWVGARIARIPRYAAGVTILGGIAVLLQVVGLVTTAYGLRVTWREFHEPGERFLDPFVRAIKRLDRRRRGVTVTPDPVELRLTVGAADVQVEFGPLPDDDRAAIEVLFQRVQGLRRNLETTSSDIRSSITQVNRRVDGLEGKVTGEIARLDRTDRHVATDGLRLESIGLVLVAGGMLAQLLDTIL